MKYIVVLGDGMADYKLEDLNNKSPLEYAKKPNIDFLSQHGELGLVNTVPDGISPGSDVANLSVLGYDPLKYYSGRSPLEAISMGINLDENDVAIRCNLVTLSNTENYSKILLKINSSDEITTEEATELMKTISEEFDSSQIKFHTGISYRHCMIWKNCNKNFELTPPHDILDREIKNYLPKQSGGLKLKEFMERSYLLLKNHPINIKRKQNGLRTANSIWLWGNGKKAQLPSFYDKYNLKGSVISAVDLIKGIGICAKLESIDVDGATGNIHTNFEGKASAALKELDNGKDFVFVHIEAPDECGHRGEVENKVKSIELIDKKIVGPLLEGLKKYDDYKIMVLPDHPTPIPLRTHTSDPVPYIIYQKSKSSKSNNSFTYDEQNAKKQRL